MTSEAIVLSVPWSASHYISWCWVQHPYRLKPVKKWDPRKLMWRSAALAHYLKSEAPPLLRVQVFWGFFSNRRETLFIVPLCHIQIELRVTIALYNISSCYATVENVARPSRNYHNTCTKLVRVNYKCSYCPASPFYIYQKIQAHNTTEVFHNRSTTV